MTGVLAKIILSAFIAGILSVDRNAFGQFQLSRPMVSALIMGVVLGCPVEGAVVGLIYELLFLGSLPAGSFIPYHPLFPSLISVLLIGMYEGPRGQMEIVGLAVLLGVPTAFLDRAVNVRWRRSNERAFHRAMVYLRLGRTDLVQLQHVLSALRAGLFHGVSFLLTGAILVLFFNALLKSFEYLPERFAIIAMVPFFIGLAALGSDRTARKGWKGFTLGLALGAGIGIWKAIP
ncbi:PTS sugar transporter subunit IIC [bacterium]|nr:PTS sugar transporter subunit IIC [bacterium]